MADVDELVYFDGRGLAEMTRILYYLADHRFNDKRVTDEEWEELKPTMPMGQIPVLTTERGTINQSNVIARYAAKKLGLCGDNLREEALHDMIVENVREASAITRDLIAWKIFDEEEPRHKEDMALKKYKQALDVAEKMSKERATKYIVGPEIGLAEVWLFTMLELAIFIIPNFLESVTPWATEFLENFKKDQRIAKYLLERPVAPYGV